MYHCCFIEIILKYYISTKTAFVNKQYRETCTFRQDILLVKNAMFTHPFNYRRLNANIRSECLIYNINNQKYAYKLSHNYY